MFKMLNKDGQILPLYMPTEDDAQKMVGVALKSLKSSLKTMGKALKGILHQLLMKSQVLKRNNITAYKEILNKQAAARVKEMHVAADYEIMSQRVDSIVIKIITQAIFLILSIVGGYGTYWGLSFVLPPIMVYVVTAIVSLALMCIPVLYLINLVKLKYQATKEGTEISEVSGSKENIKDSFFLKKLKIPLLPFFVKRFQKGGNIHSVKSYYRRAFNAVLAEHFPVYLMNPKIAELDIYICVNCSRPTPISKYNRQISCNNCGCKYKASSTDITLVTFDEKELLDEKVAFSKKIAEKLQTYISQTAIRKHDYVRTSSTRSLTKVVDDFYEEVNEKKKTNKD